MFRLACILATASAVAGQFSLDGVKCGQLNCQLDEYCSADTHRCAPCSVVCNKTHHNYDSGLCNKDCQGYLLDLRYMRRGDSPADISGVQRLAEIALIISGIALAVFVLVLVILCRGKFTWRYIKQKFKSNNNRIKQYPGDLTHHNPHAEMAKPKNELKLEIRNPEPKLRQSQPLNVHDLEKRNSQTEKSQGATTPKTISTTISSRHPAEDATLDAYAYDNMAMNVTPPQPAASTRSKF